MRAALHADATNREPPANPEAEQGLLGAILVSNSAFHSVSGFLQAEHFSVTVHGRIFAAMADLIGRGMVANPVTLKAFFDRDTALATIGGAQYLAQLAASFVTIINAEDYGRTILTLYQARQMIEAFTDGIETLYGMNFGSAPDDVLAAASATIVRLEAHRSADPLPTFAALLDAAAARAEKMWRGEMPPGLATGFLDLDGLLGGLEPAQLIIGAGRPSMGKTALAIQIAYHVARQGARVLMFSREMSGEQLANRFASAESRVSMQAIKCRTASWDEICRFTAAAADLKALPIVIDDLADTIAAMERHAQRMKRGGGVALVVVDYLQLIQPAKSGHENRTAAVGEITRGLKEMAKRLAVPVLALAQLSRAVEAREDRRPMMSDLRESGAIEQDADIVALLYRESYYLARSEPKPRGDESTDHFNNRHENWREQLRAADGLADVIVPKNRSGPVGSITLHFDEATMRFDNAMAGERVPWTPDA